MIKLRVQGEAKEVEQFLKIIRNLKQLEILAESDNYKNRSSVYIRKYIDCEPGNMTKNKAWG